MKTNFELELGEGDKGAGHSLEIKIIGTHPDSSPYVAVYASGLTECTQASGWIADQDLEKFAVNILRALGSKKLKTNTRSKKLKTNTK